MIKKSVILFYPSSTAAGDDTNFPWPLVYLERMIRHLEIDVILLDERLNKDYIDVILRNKDRLLLAGVSSITGFQIIGGLKFSEAVRYVTGAPVIWGGWFPTVYPDMILKDGYASYVCVGQGEAPFRTFTERMLKGESVYDIPGIGYKKDGEIFINPHSKLIDPDTFPRVDISLIDVNLLIDLNGKVEQKYRDTDYLASTGCPHSCSFCNMTLYVGGRWFPKKINEIIEDLRYLKEKASITHIAFWDDNFFASKKFILEFCNDMIRSGLGLTWEGETHVGSFLNTFNDEDIELMYRSGCRRIKVGAESGDQDVLDLVNKKAKVKDNIQIIKLLKKHKLQIKYLTMLCFPNDPDRDFWRTLNLIGRVLLIDPMIAVIITFYKPIPKTTLYKLCMEKGYISPANTDELVTKLTDKAYAPWYRMDYHRKLDDFLNFYFLYTNPKYFLTFPKAKKPIMFILNMLMYPIVLLRFKLNWMKFPVEAKLFKKSTGPKKEIMFFDTISFNKSRVLKPKK